MTSHSNENTSSRPSHIAYTVVAGKTDGKNFWHQIGACWPTKGNGFFLRLHATPVDGNIVLRSLEEQERFRAERKENNTSQHTSYYTEHIDDE